jgi:peptide/nickel transport system substrate-binding protein
MSAQMRVVLTRRELLRRSAMASAAVGIAACVPSTTAPAGTSAATAAATAAPSLQPKRGGVLTWAQWDANMLIDPANPSGSASLEIIGNVLDPLILLDDKQQIHPLLATKWQIDDAARRYTFTLRDGVKFHDGTPLDSSAVKRTWERILDPRTKAPGVAALLGTVDAISTPDARTVVITYKDSNYSLPYQLWRPYLGISSPKQLDVLKPGDVMTSLVGTGPFVWAGRSPDGVVTLKANADYVWASDLFTNAKAPYIDEVRFRGVTEPATRIATLESGESLLIDEIPEPDYARLKADTRFAFVETIRRGPPIGWFINVQRPPTTELAVRQALNWAVDRKAIVDKLFFGVHKPAVGVVTEGVWARVDELENRYSYDPAKAKQILEDAGWKVGAGNIREKNGQKLTLVLATFRDPWSTIADVVQSQWREIGIDVQVNKLARGPYLDLVRSPQNLHNLCASAGGGFDPDLLRERYGGAAVRNTNFSNLADPALDALLDAGPRQPLGSAERRKTYEDAQRRLMDLAPVVSILTQLRVEAATKRLRSLRMGPDGLNALPLNDTWLE